MVLQVDASLVAAADTVRGEHRKYRGMGNSTRGRAVDVAAQVEDAVGDFDLRMVPLEPALLQVVLPVDPTQAQVRTAVQVVTGLADGARSALWGLRDIRTAGGSTGPAFQAPGDLGEHLRAVSTRYRKIVDDTRSRRRTDGLERAPRRERQAERAVADLRLTATLAGFLCLSMAAGNPDVRELRVLAAAGLGWR